MTTVIYAYIIVYTVYIVHARGHAELCLVWPSTRLDGANTHTYHAVVCERVLVLACVYIRA